MAPTTDETHALLAEIPNLTVSNGVPLARYTRFGIGGPADLFAETSEVRAFLAALSAARSTGIPIMVIGGGTNLIVSDLGFRGLVIRYQGAALEKIGDRVIAESGASLQAVVDFAIGHGLKGLETLAGIPGSFGAAIYGNAGAYGHSISERLVSVLFFDGVVLRTFNQEECQFKYRESVFKSQKHWIIFSAVMLLEPAAASSLREAADEILRTRNAKFPVTMKCAGSVFKNLLVRELPESVASLLPAPVVRDGKAPAAWFLEQVGAKGVSRGDIHVADYHANLIYNAGEGTAVDLCALIQELKRRVRERFGIQLEEEVQYVGY